MFKDNSVCNFKNIFGCSLQNRYYSNASHSSDEIYNIPITYTTQNIADFETTKPVFIMKNKTHQFSIANISQDHSWVIFNIQETGTMPKTLIFLQKPFVV